jgi:hypothetical protein
MAGRKRTVVRPPPECGRDHEKGWLFLITEWYADRAEKWAERMLFALTRDAGGIPIDPERLIGTGMNGIFALGMQTLLAGKMRSEEVIPLLDELLDCVQVIRDPKVRAQGTGEPVATRISSPDDIEEVGTRLWLKSEVIKLHTGFSPAGALSTLISAIMAASPASPST